MNLFDLTKRTAFVSGATHGLGMSIALGLAEAGAKLIISSTSEKVRKSFESIQNTRL